MHSPVCGQLASVERENEELKAQLKELRRQLMEAQQERASASEARSHLQEQMRRVVGRLDALESQSSIGAEKVATNVEQVHRQVTTVSADVAHLVQQHKSAQEGLDVRITSMYACYCLNRVLA